MASTTSSASGSPLRPAVVTIGGAVLDVIARPSHHLIPSTSNPGKVIQRCGGVSRNVAEGIARLMGSEASFLISVVGDDVSGRFLIDKSKAIPMPTSGIVPISGVSTGCYCATIDEKGDLVQAIADMECLSRITPELIMRFKDELSAAKYIVVDADVSPESILILSNSFPNVPIVYEPTCVAKSGKLITAKVMDRISMITPDIHELEAMANAVDPTSVPAATSFDFDGWIRALIVAVFRSGVRDHVVAKLGARGVLLGSRNRAPGAAADDIVFQYFHAIPVTKIVNVNGAGDSLVAGLLFGLISGKDVAESMTLGLKAAKLSVESEDPVSLLLTRDFLMG